jgi:uncharacterized protein DUF4360
MRRTTVGGLFAALSVALLGVVAPASAAQAAAPSVAVVGANGTGCPIASAGPASAGPLSSGSTFDISFDGYYLYTDNDSTTADFRRNCQFSLQVTRPAGWTYAVEGAEYSGFALLDAGVKGAQYASYYFQGQSTTVSRSHVFEGTRTWTSTDEIDSASLVWAPCDAERLLNINTELRITGRPTTSEFNGVFLDPTFSVDLAWRKC